MPYFVYLLASSPHGTLYCGVTNDLTRRMEQHRSGCKSAFVGRYYIYRLVWWTEFADINEAIAMEKRIKRWRRDWKIALIEKSNPQWDDLIGEV